MFSSFFFKEGKEGKEWKMKENIVYFAFKNFLPNVGGKGSKRKK